MKKILHSSILGLAGAILILCCCSGRGESETDKTKPAPEPSASGLCYVSGGRLLSPSGEELSLLGVNFQTPLSWEANRLKKVGLTINSTTLKEVTDNNLEDVVLLGARLLRCHLTPADFTDSEGNLQETPYLDALDYLVYRAGEEGLYLSFAFLNHMGVSGPGKSWIGKDRETWIIDEAIVKKTRNYIQQLVERKNPYSQLKYKDTPAIAYWELINEPAMYSYQDIANTPYADVYSSWLKANKKSDTQSAFSTFRSETVRNYIDGITDTLRSLGDAHPVCWGLNWHRYRRNNADIFEGVAASKADIVAFCNYPGQDLVEQDYYNYRHDLSGENFTSWFNKYYDQTDGYGWARSAPFASKAKIVYEFESFFNLTAYLYPTQAVFFKSLSAQTASMWTYTFAEIAEYFGGSHFLNIRCTPAKAASFIVARHVFEKEERGITTRIAEEMKGDTWCISRSRGAAVYADGLSYCNSGPVPEDWNPLPPTGKEKQIAGYGSSPLVTYDGSGMYLIEDKDEGLYLTLLPDVKRVGDPYAKPSYSTKVTLLDSTTSHNLSIRLTAWEHLDCSLFRIEGKEKNFVGKVNGIQSLRLSPGKYVILPDHV